MDKVKTPYKQMAPKKRVVTSQTDGEEAKRRKAAVEQTPYKQMAGVQTPSNKPDRRAGGETA